MRRSTRLGTVLAALAAATASSAAAEPACHPAAVVTGDATVVGAVAAELARHDVALEPAAGCPHVQAAVTADGDSLVVDVVDGAGRRSRRRVAYVSEAASVIESWARPDLNADLLMGFELPRRDGGDPVTPAAAASAVGSVLATSRRDTLSLAIGGDLSVDRSSGFWTGVTASLCAPVGRLCIGGVGHLRRSNSDGARVEQAVLVAAALPVRSGRLGIMPGLAVGVARSSSTFTFGGDTQESAAWSARAEAHVIASYPLARWLFAELSAAADVAPFASGGQQQDGMAAPPDPGLWLRGGLGLRVGAP